MKFGCMMEKEIGLKNIYKVNVQDILRSVNYHQENFVLIPKQVRR